MLPTQHQTANSLPALSSEIGITGATNMVEASLPSVVKCLAAMKADPVLSHIDFNRVSFSELVFKILKQGSVLERAALAKNLTPEAAYFFPSAWHQITGRNGIPIQTAIDNIFKPMFGLLAEHFGVSFNGNMDSVAYTLLTEFGGMSFADFLICFDRVKSGQYWRETQHIMTRGINYEFMAGWLNEYAADRELARAEIYNQNKPDNKPMVGLTDAADAMAAIRESIETVQRQRIQLQRDADDIFIEWENALFTSAVLRQGFKTASVEHDDLDANGLKRYNADGTVKKRFIQQEIICEADDPEANRFEQYVIRKPVPGGIAKKVKRIIFEFITNGDAGKTVRLYDDLAERIRKKYSDSANVELALEAELKTLITMFGTIKRQFSPNIFIEAVLRKCHPSAPENQIMFSVAQTVSMFEKQYFDWYLPDCIQRKYPRLDKLEFITVSALVEFQNQGFQNPFKQILE